jgi:formylglycine-generating enzyme required for sulfatase activity
VTNAVITSISVEAQPVKTEYAVNDSLDLSGIVIRGTDSLAVSRDITGECTPTYNFSTPGTKTITITHTPSGKTANFDVTVLPHGIPFYNMKSISGRTVTKDIGEDGAFYDAGTEPVSVPSFKIGETEITWELWKAVYEWATDASRGANRYTFANPGQQGGSPSTTYPVGTNQHPVTAITWWDALAWCNAYSEIMGKTPVYKYAGAVLRESESYGYYPEIDSAADGYRLPTEAEWEYAARGGDPDAAYWDYTYAGSNTAYNVAVFNVTQTAAVKSKAANALGLYDMSGNVWEWCGDIEFLLVGLQTIKGGGFSDTASDCDIGVWWPLADNGYVYYDVGFRVVCKP